MMINKKARVWTDSNTRAFYIDILLMIKRHQIAFILPTIQSVHWL